MNTMIGKLLGQNFDQKSFERLLEDMEVDENDERFMLNLRALIGTDTVLFSIISHRVEALIQTAKQYKEDNDGELD